MRLCQIGPMKAMTLASSFLFYFTDSHELRITAASISGT
jgi:hypothetical protein